MEERGQSDHLVAQGIPEVWDVRECDRDVTYFKPTVREKIFSKSLRRFRIRVSMRNTSILLMSFGMMESGICRNAHWLHIVSQS